MANLHDVTTACPGHRMLACVGRSDIIRSGLHINLSLMRILRDLVDRRLIRLQKAEYASLEKRNE